MQSTKPRANAVITVRQNETNPAVYTFAVVGADPGSFSLNTDKVAQALKDIAWRKGIIARVSMGAALDRDTTTGKPATPQSKYEACKRIAEHLESGSEQWELPRGNVVRDDSGMVLRAMMRVYKVATVDEVNGMVDMLASKRSVNRDDAIKVFADTKEVAGAMADIRAEDARQRAQASVGDAMALLDELTGDAG